MRFETHALVEVVDGAVNLLELLQEVGLTKKSIRHSIREVRAVPIDLPQNPIYDWIDFCRSD